MQSLLGSVSKSAGFLLKCFLTAVVIQSRRIYTPGKKRHTAVHLKFYTFCFSLSTLCTTWYREEHVSKRFLGWYGSNWYDQVRTRVFFFPLELFEVTSLMGLLSFGQHFTFVCQRFLSNLYCATLPPRVLVVLLCFLLGGTYCTCRFGVLRIESSIQLSIHPLSLVGEGALETSPAVSGVRPPTPH